MITQESVALYAWYGSRPEIRRLRAIRDTDGLRVIVHLEPTADGNDIHPAWMANRRTWLDELELQTGTAVRLESVDVFVADDEGTSAEGVVIADLAWRDPSVI